MTNRSQTLPWWRGGGEKTAENKIHWPRTGEGERQRVW